jgi:hypothetical protein
LQGALRTMRRGLIVLTRGGRVGYATEPAAALMQKYFGRGTFGEKRLPREVESWLAGAARRGRDYRTPPAPLRAHGPDGLLKICLAPNGTTGELVLSVEEKLRPSPEAIRALGLTRREADVMFWVARGKTDWEVGFTLRHQPAHRANPPRARLREARRREPHGGHPEGVGPLEDVKSRPRRTPRGAASRARPLGVKRGPAHEEPAPFSSIEVPFPAPPQTRSSA